MAEVPIGKIIEAYLQLRAKKDKLREKQKLEMAPLLAMEAKLNGVLLNHLNLTNTDSVALRGVGTAYKTTVTSVTVEDWAATLDWIKDKEAWEFLERRVSKQVVQDFMASTDEVPPGVRVTQDVEVRVVKKQ